MAGSWESLHVPSADQAKKLADELSALSNEQSEALRIATFLGFSEERARGFDRRAARIGELRKLLGEV
jgi:hypothetical protein